MGFWGFWEVPFGFLGGRPQPLKKPSPKVKMPFTLWGAVNICDRLWHCRGVEWLPKKVPKNKPYLGQAILWLVFLHMRRQLHGQRTYLRPGGALRMGVASLQLVHLTTCWSRLPEMSIFSCSEKKTDLTAFHGKKMIVCQKKSCEMKYCNWKYDVCSQGFDSFGQLRI